MITRRLKLPDMTITAQRPTKDRIADIEQEIRGVKSLYNITDFECRVMATLKTQQSGSEPQLKILASIERCVILAR